MLNYAQLSVIGLITQALPYGIYLATLIHCLRWLIFTDEGWKPREKLNSLTMASATIFIFLTSTINIITSLQSTIEISHAYGIDMATSITGLLTTLSIDSVMIYRCWIVYAKSWCAIWVPVTFWLASLGISAWLCYYEFIGQYRVQIIKVVDKGLTGLYASNIAITVYATTAIIYRIWYTRKTSGGSPKRLNYIMRILAESGILYTSTLLFSLAGTLLSAPEDATWVDFVIYGISNSINFSMAGIAFNLIVIRIYQSRVELPDSMADSSGGEKTISGIEFNKHQATASSEGPSSSSNVPDEGIDLIQEHRRSIDGVHKN